MSKILKQTLPGASPLWVVVLVLLTVLAASLTNAWREYDQALEHEFRLLEVHAHQREASIVGAIDSVNLMLRNITMDFNEKPTLTPFERNRLLQDALRQLPQLRSLIVTNALGRVSASNNEQLVGFDASTREYFTVHRDAPLNASSHISAPFKTVTGVIATTVSQAMVDSNRRFAGIVVATFDSAYFNKALEYRVASPGNQVALVHQNGTILSSVPNAKLVGQSIAGGPAFTAHRAGDVPTSRHINVTKLAQTKRLVVVRDIGAVPMVLILSRDFDAAIAEWRRAMLIQGAGFLSLAGITLLASGLAWRRQRALVERERFIKTVTDAMPGMVGYWDQHLRCRFANKTYLEWFGKAPEFIIGETALSLFGEALFEKNAPLMREALKGHPQQFERTLAKADGSVGHAWAHYIPDVREANGVVGFFVLVTDVTSLKAAEFRARESEAFARAVLDSMTEHVAVIDVRGVITSVNAAWQQFSIENGASEPAKVSVGANYLEACGHASGTPNCEEAAPVLAGIRSVLDGSLAEFALEYPCHAPTEQRWFVLRVLPLRGASPGAVLIHQNVTDQHLADAALRSSEAHFRMLAENMADLVWKADAQMRFTYVNAADYRMRGFEKNEVLGHSIAEALTPQGKVLLADLLKKRQEAEAQGQRGVSLAFDIPMRRKNGGQIWMEISTMPTYDGEGKIAGFQGVGRDISERKQRESELVESQNDLQSQLQQAARQKNVLLEQALRDPLTGLSNRRYLDETLPRELSRAKRDGASLSVIMLDLDHFKRVNDTYSHAAGDEVLKALATLLKAGARDSDVICRYGGEEFVVIMPNMAAAHAFARVESWRIELETMTVKYGDFQINITLSAGIAEYPAHGDVPEVLLARADEMLYRSKHEGRNRVAVFG